MTKLDYFVFDNVLGKGRARTIIDESFKESRETFRKVAAEAKDGDKQYLFTKRTFDALLFMSKMIRAELALAISMSTKRNSDLEARIAALEGGSVKYFGVWKPETEYRPGSMVTHQGACWCAIVKALGDKPGTSGAWTLAVKAGRDGKDAR